MERTLANALRPNRLSKVIGQDALVARIKNQYKSKREPSGWVFVGPSGTGKTTLARIIAISLQCRHQTEFGEPCDDCIKQEKSFAIQEINASEIRGIDQISEIAKGSLIVPLPPSRRRVITLDEAQRVTEASQNLLLKYLEDAPATTVWMICTTEEEKILLPNLRRLQRGQLKPLQADDITKLVNRGIVYTKSDKKVVPLVQALWEAKVQSPGFILNAVEAYVNGMKAKEAVQSIGRFADTMAICRSLEQGDWDAIRKETSNATSDDLRAIRAAVAGYLRRALESKVPGPPASGFAKAIRLLASVDTYTDATQGAATVATLYEICQLYTGPEQDTVDDDR